MWVILLVLALGIGLSWREIFKRYKLFLWKKNLNICHYEQQFNQLFKKVDGFLISKQERQHQNIISLTYGEIDFLSFVALMDTANISEQSVFYDLGSGLGKPVIACALVFNVKKSVGIEKLRQLYDASVKINPCANAYFINDDFLTQDFSEATHVFINSTTFFGQEWTNAQSKLSQCLPGTVVITTSKPINLPGFKLITTCPIRMSWGIVTAYISLRS
jgi:Histone methylation protein DOT1